MTEFITLSYHILPYRPSLWPLLLLSLTCLLVSPSHCYTSWGYMMEPDMIDLNPSLTPMCRYPILRSSALPPSIIYPPAVVFFSQILLVHHASDRWWCIRRLLLSRGLSHVLPQPLDHWLSLLSLHLYPRHIVHLLLPPTWPDIPLSLVQPSVPPPPLRPLMKQMLFGANWESFMFSIWSSVFPSLP